MAILDVCDVTKRFGAVTAVDGVSFRVGPGEVVGLLGPNGAGKTTTLHMVLGLVTPDAGEVRLFGERLDGSSPWNLTTWCSSNHMRSYHHTKRSLASH
jgi:ABC-type multidrug transport system ATPase subunit